MNLISGIGKIRLKGKKELTKSKEIVSIPEPPVIYIPLIIGASTNFEVHVKEGDKVSKGQSWPLGKICMFRFIALFREL